ncbi:cytochrome-c peroxidase [Shewanella sp. D64]|uniref:cytochrome-c peroxidase n=1 Tax=unclassified Shewanella TaxID=196818 RepID=UPI0022BA4089|nr:MULTISPECIES: cytochrome c peroxidase [unclassified Shewanella]MEC4727326.1 cytochrome-c peroxidase [Shewanella sp. D64]MEC4739481.1 cytochrome-c peroxidase [Shewanella sp. E94]WBJ96810.1 cytochrome-c peroxidase [Shewanella sp. MTB7]
MGETSFPALGNQRNSILLLIGALLISACGSDNEVPVSNTPETPDTPSTNTPPTLTLSTRVVSLEANSSVIIVVSASDPDDDNLTISISTSTLISSNYGNNELTLTATNIQVEQLESITVSLSDGIEIVSQDINVTLIPALTTVSLLLPEVPFNYADIPLPQHYLQNAFPVNFQFQSAAIESDNTPANNLMTNAGATLGRALFYDTKLSANDTVSCASCHVQELGFSDSRALSIGFDGGETRRHSMGLANARFYQSGKFFWDERASSLEVQVLTPIQDEVEMGLSLAELVANVSAQPYYPQLFSDAFGDALINSERIAMALAQFVRAMVNIDAKYDQGRAAVNDPLQAFPNFTPEENDGKRLFMTFRNGIPPCSSCHSSEAFVGPLIAPDSNATTIASNNGLDESSDDDLGVFESTGINGHTGKFKVPSLRNIAVRPPYMHDGRFASLEETIEHYSSGIKPHPTLQQLLKDQNGAPVRYNFTPQEQTDLIAFLSTLTDEEFLNDEKFSDPFIR